MMFTSLSSSKVGSWVSQLFPWRLTFTGNLPTLDGRAHLWQIQKRTETCFARLSLCIWKDFPKNTKFLWWLTTETKWFSKTEVVFSIKLLGISLVWVKVKPSPICMEQKQLPGETKKA